MYPPQDELDSVSHRAGKKSGYNGPSTTVVRVPPCHHNCVQKILQEELLLYELAMFSVTCFLRSNDSSPALCMVFSSFGLGNLSSVGSKDFPLLFAESSPCCWRAFAEAAGMSSWYAVWSRADCLESDMLVCFPCLRDLWLRMRMDRLEMKTWGYLQLLTDYKINKICLKSRQYDW